ncbi:hypothetical protein L1987_53524 [Smallanthus sonchifolius]|uniref:Uncharacterized protein n=1 Tax=Smallanthus sonchifolius TaxID=185202 RepID=A0ACB9EVL4_9ASTR|nr:hypothetical protein L1987_53524 [Smallanthus sonchifolius]
MRKALRGRLIGDSYNVIETTTLEIPAWSSEAYARVDIGFALNKGDAGRSSRGNDRVTTRGVERKKDKCGIAHKRLDRKCARYKMRRTANELNYERQGALLGDNRQDDEIVRVIPVITA